MSSSAVAACTQIIGRSGPGARADAGRTAVHWRPPCGSHTAHAGNSRYKTDDLADHRPGLGVKPGQRLQQRLLDPVAVTPSGKNAVSFHGTFSFHLMPEGADIAVQSLARAARTRRSISRGPPALAAWWPPGPTAA